MVKSRQIERIGTSAAIVLNSGMFKLLCTKKISSGVHGKVSMDDQGQRHIVQPTHRNGL